MSHRRRLALLGLVPLAAWFLGPVWIRALVGMAAAYGLGMLLRLGPERLRASPLLGLSSWAEAGR